MEIRTKRVYEPVEPDDGYRVLVDRVWPRGVGKEKLQAQWLKDIAPSTELRQWFAHDPAKWDEFRQRYGKELEQHPEELRQIWEQSDHGPVTLVYSAKDEQHNQAVALKEWLESHRGRGSR